MSQSFDDDESVHLELPGLGEAKKSFIKFVDLDHQNTVFYGIDPNRKSDETFVNGFDIEFHEKYLKRQERFLNQRKQLDQKYGVTSPVAIDLLVDPYQVTEDAPELERDSLSEPNLLQLEPETLQTVQNDFLDEFNIDFQALINPDSQTKFNVFLPHLQKTLDNLCQQFYGERVTPHKLDTGSIPKSFMNPELNPKNMISCQGAKKMRITITSIHKQMIDVSMLKLALKEKIENGDFEDDEEGVKHQQEKLNLEVKKLRAKTKSVREGDIVSICVTAPQVPLNYELTKDLMDQIKPGPRKKPRGSQVKKGIDISQEFPWRSKNNLIGALEPFNQSSSVHSGLSASRYQNSPKDQNTIMIHENQRLHQHSTLDGRGSKLTKNKGTSNMSLDQKYKITYPGTNSTVAERRKKGLNEQAFIQKGSGKDNFILNQNQKQELKQGKKFAPSTSHQSPQSLTRQKSADSNSLKETKPTSQKKKEEIAPRLKKYIQMMTNKMEKAMKEELYYSAVDQADIDKNLEFLLVRDFEMSNKLEDEDDYDATTKEALVQYILEETQDFGGLKHAQQSKGLQRTNVNSSVSIGDLTGSQHYETFSQGGNKIMEPRVNNNKVDQSTSNIRSSSMLGDNIKPEANSNFIIGLSMSMRRKSTFRVPDLRDSHDRIKFLSHQYTTILNKLNQMTQDNLGYFHQEFKDLKKQIQKSPHKHKQKGAADYFLKSMGLSQEFSSNQAKSEFIQFFNQHSKDLATSSPEQIMKQYYMYSRKENIRVQTNESGHFERVELHNADDEEFTLSSQQQLQPFQRVMEPRGKQLVARRANSPQLPLHTTDSITREEIERQLIQMAYLKQQTPTIEEEDDKQKKSSPSNSLYKPHIRWKKDLSTAQVQNSQDSDDISKSPVMNQELDGDLDSLNKTADRRFFQAQAQTVHASKTRVGEQAKSPAGIVPRKIDEMIMTPKQFAIHVEAVQRQQELLNQAAFKNKAGEASVDDYQLKITDKSQESPSRQKMNLHTERSIKVPWNDSPQLSKQVPESPQKSIMVAKNSKLKGRRQTEVKSQKSEQVSFKSTTGNQQFIPIGPSEDAVTKGEHFSKTVVSQSEDETTEFNQNIEVDSDNEQKDQDADQADDYELPLEQIQRLEPVVLFEMKKSDKQKLHLERYQQPTQKYKNLFNKQALRDLRLKINKQNYKNIKDLDSKVSDEEAILDKLFNSPIKKQGLNEDADKQKPKKKQKKGKFNQGKASLKSSRAFQSIKGSIEQDSKFQESSQKTPFNATMQQLDLSSPAEFEPPSSIDANRRTVPEINDEYSHSIQSRSLKKPKQSSYASPDETKITFENQSYKKNQLASHMRFKSGVYTTLSIAQSKQNTQHDSSGQRASFSNQRAGLMNLNLISGAYDNQLNPWQTVHENKKMSKVINRIDLNNSTRPYLSPSLFSHNLSPKANLMSSLDENRQKQRFKRMRYIDQPKRPDEEPGFAQYQNAFQHFSKMNDNFASEMKFSKFKLRELETLEKLGLRSLGFGSVQQVRPKEGRETKFQQTLHNYFKSQKHTLPELTGRHSNMGGGKQQQKSRNTQNQTQCKPWPRSGLQLHS